MVSEDSMPPTPGAGKSRLWIFRLAAVVLVPLVFFSLLEIGLRLGGYGYSADFFISPDRSDSVITNKILGCLLNTAGATLIKKKPADTAIKCLPP